MVVAFSYSCGSALQVAFLLLMLTFLYASSRFIERADDAKRKTNGSTSYFPTEIVKQFSEGALSGVLCGDPAICHNDGGCRPNVPPISS